MTQLLIIDDDASSLKTLRLVLEGRISSRIETTQSAHAALKLLKQSEFDVVLSDIKMPGMDGLSLLGEIQSIRPELPVILTSAYEEPEILLKAIRAGAYDFIRKPLDVDYLVASVTRATQHSESIREVERKHKALEVRAAELEREVELRERHRLLIESVVDYAIFTLDIKGNITSWNIGAQRAKGYRADEIIGRHFSCFYSKEDIAARKPDIELEIASAQGRVEDEGWRLRKDGSKFWANVVITALKNSDGTLRGFGKVTRDLTERKRIEESKEVLLQEKTARLTAEAMNRAKDQFFATLSHELRSPLTPLLGWAKMLRSGKLDMDTQLRGLAVIERNVNAQAKLIEDILDVSRIITGKFALNVRQTNLVRIVEAAVDVVRPSADAKGIQIHSSFPNDNIAFTGDPDRLQQIAWNLLTNAVKFTPQDGSIQIRLRTINENIELMVSDTGIGLTPEFLPHIFERLSQADNSASRVHGGLGIGLSLVKSLVELHGGLVTANSPGEGKGSVFTVTLPKSGADPTQDPGGQPPKQNALFTGISLHGASLLVVEDEEDSRELISFALRQAGADVTTASSVANALESIQRKKPDLIVSDLGMPVEDGFVLIRKLREIESRAGRLTPAIALTSYAQDGDRSRCLTSGFNVHMAKPIDPAALVFAVSKLLEKHNILNPVGEEPAISAG